MNILEKNLFALNKTNPKLAERVLSHTQLQKSAEFCTSASEDTNLLYDNVLVHDKDDPVQEAYDLFQKVSFDRKTDIHILFGLGLGYVFKRFCMSAKGRILLIEPNLDILRLTLEVVDLSAELSRDKVLLIDDLEDLKPYYEKLFYIQSETTFTSLDAYKKLNTEFFIKLIEEIPYVTGIYISNYNNLMKKSFFWTDFGLKNLSTVVNNYNLEDLRGKFKGLPAVVVSAGPSLDESIKEIKKYRDKCVIFSTGAALKSLYKHDIIPDFALFVEFNDSNSQFFGLDLSSTNIILQPSTHREVHKIKAKRMFNYYPNNDFFNKWFAKVIDIPLDDYYNKGSVSLTSMFSAKIMGCDPIILTGQDLAYTGGRCYTSSNPNANLICVYNEELKKFEVKPENEEQYLKEFLLDYDDRVRTLKYAAMGRVQEINSGLVTVKGQNGELLPTDGGYALFIKYFEEMAKVFGHEVKLYNCSKGGANIEGYENSTVEEVLGGKPPINFPLESVINKSLTGTLINSKKRELLVELGVLKKLFVDSLTVLNRGLNYATKAGMELDKSKAHTPLTKRYFEDAIACYTNIANNYIHKNQVFWGITLKEFFDVSYYIETYELSADYVVSKTYIDKLNNFFSLSITKINDSITSIDSVIKSIE